MRSRTTKPAPRSATGSSPTPRRRTPIAVGPLLGLGLPLLLGGCAAVGPEYVAPQIELGESWSAVEPAEESPASREALDPDELGRWWEQFEDPTLDRLVDTALIQNLGVRQAASRIAEARATLERTVGRRLPTVDSRLAVSETRQSENGPLPIDRIPGLDRDQTLVDLGLDASWEADLFGRTRRAIEVAEARLGSAEEDHRAAQFAITAEVVRIYLQLRGGQRRLAAVEAATTSVRDTAELVSKRVAAGEIAPVEQYRVETDLRALESRLPALRSGLRALALALGPLVGELPEWGLSLLDQDRGAPRLAPFPLGERAELLRRRPDVRSAERRLVAATAEIGLAIAELYPRLSIGARGGFQALDGSDLLAASSTTWSLVPAIRWRIFDRGRVRAEIRIAEARAETAALAWEATVLDALGDAERALARYRGGLDALAYHRAAVGSATRTRDLERLRWEAGETTLLTLLDAERRLDELEADLEETRVTAAEDLVTLIKALGGGWAG